MNDPVPKNHRKVLSLISDVSRVVRCCQQEAAFCENVTFSQFLILDAVAGEGRLKLSELHKILSVDKSTTTRLVDPLVKQGLVVRERSNRDSRAVNLILTREGESVRKKVWACLSGFVDAIETKIPEGRREEVYDAVRIFLDATRDACGEGTCEAKLSQ